jgi:hypothetical protein
MSDDRNKISLRKGPKRNGTGRPTISAPRQISNPIAQDEAPPRPVGLGKAVSGGPAPRPRPLPQNSVKVSCGWDRVCCSGKHTNNCRRRTWSSAGIRRGSRTCPPTLMQAHRPFPHSLHLTITVITDDRERHEAQMGAPWWIARHFETHRSLLSSVSLCRPCIPKGVVVDAPMI